MKKHLLTFAILSSLSLAAAANQYQAGDMVVRGGVINVKPSSDKAGVYVEALGGETPLTVSVNDNSQPGLNFIYFYDNNWAVEVVAATPFTHDVKIHDMQGISEGIFGVDVDGVTLAEVTHLPPTVSALYYFDTESAVQPYVGVGVNYTVFFDEKFKSAPKSLGFNHINLDSSIGLSAQFGVDFQLDDNWHINASVRYIDIDTEANFKIGDVIKASSDISVDPMAYSVMLGYKF
ncbi:OmpW family outer membrane protein [Thalassotalea sp. G2M2-11]|uniref:OmpW/AlkL family protein n=1 Tax=Thalassotalea sp. G2M2-11 TaxID=2787627 RepID=UPI0019D221F2|nr:OmpW family outer membrane protein [Thalassotalea sp. G2M2-11]